MRQVDSCMLTQHGRNTPASRTSHEPMTNSKTVLGGRGGRISDSGSASADP
jgi:hypothetical protein